MNKRSLRRCIGLLSVITLTLAVLLAFSPSQTVYAASITINASCSLSDAITAANTDTATGGCPAGNGADTITLSAGITLGAALPDISSEITIQGAGFTISGNNSYRIFNVASGGNLRIHRLSLSNGKPSSQGGAIYNAGTATITNSTFRNNGNSGFQGGAIYNTGTLTVTNSTFSGNSGSQGGAIYNAGTATITNSTFSGNSASQGGALFRQSAGTTQLRNSILAGSSGGDCSGELTLDIYNLIQDGSCSPMLSGDPLLGALTGSPAYFPLLNDSPAISVGYPQYCPATDQAGTARPTGTACDLGAYEHEQNDWRTPRDCGLPSGVSRNIPHHNDSLYITESTTYTLTSDCTVLGELRNDLVAGESITINGNGHTIYVPAGERFIYVGDGAAMQIYNVTISGGGSDGIAILDARDVNTRVTLNQVTVRSANGIFLGVGGHVGSTVTATLRDITIVNSSPNSSLIRAWTNTTMTITNGRFTNNHVPNAVVVTHDDATITFEGCLTFANNTPRNTLEYLGNGTIVDNSTGPCDATATATPTATATATATPTATPTFTPTPECAGTATEAPSAPTNLLGSFGTGGVTLSWTAPEGGADGYEVSRHVHYLPGSNVLEVGGIATLGYGSSAHTGTTFYDTAVVRPDNLRYTLYYADVAYYRYRVAAVSLDANCDPLKGSYSDWVRVNSPGALTTATPTATLTPVPANNRVIGAVRLVSNQPGELQASWDVPSETPHDYRINWAKVGESFPSWRDSHGNAYLTSPSYTITGLDEGVRYKVKVRARYNGSSGDWTEPVEADVAGSS